MSGAMKNCQVDPERYGYSREEVINECHVPRQYDRTTGKTRWMGNSHPPAFQVTLFCDGEKRALLNIVSDCERSEMTIVDGDPNAHCRGMARSDRRLLVTGRWLHHIHLVDSGAVIGVQFVGSA
jgi:hypothetical protein